MALPYQDDPEEEEYQRQQALQGFDRRLGSQLGTQGLYDDTRLKIAENALIARREAPEPEFVRPQISKKRKIFGNILLPTKFGHYAGAELLYGPEREAWQDYNLALKRRQRENIEGQQNVNTLTGQFNRETDEPFKIQRQQAMIGKAESGIELDLARARTEGARQNYYNRENYKLGRPGSMVVGGYGGQVVDKGDPSAYGQAGGNVYMPIGPGMGTVNRATGQYGITPNAAEAAASRAANRAAGGTGSAALDTKARQIEDNKAKGYQKHKEQYDKEHRAIKDKYRNRDTTTPTLEDGSPNPDYGAMEREIGDLNKWDAQWKNQHEINYTEARKQQGLPTGVPPHQFAPTQENMDVSGLGSPSDMAPATGGEDIGRLRQELGPGEILVQDPESGRYFAAHENQRDELESEGYEIVEDQ